MLVINADIIFTIPNRVNYGKVDLRPAFNFGEEKLFSGTIIASCDELYYGNNYNVDLYFFTIGVEAYENIKHLVVIGKEITIQEGGRVIGVAMLLDFIYLDWEM